MCGRRTWKKLGQEAVRQVQKARVANPVVADELEEQRERLSCISV